MKFGRSKKRSSGVRGGSVRYRLSILQIGNSEMSKETLQFDQKLVTEIIKKEGDLQGMVKKISNRNVVVFMGNTKSGKSTLINYLIGSELTVLEESKRIFKIHKATRSTIGPQIGHTSVSCTTIPGIYQFGNRLIVDAPGFDDNRDEIQDILNSIYINQIKHAKSIKFVLICDINDLLMDNINGFLHLMKKAEELFGKNLVNFKTSFSIIFTKDHREYDRIDMIDLLNDKILIVDGLDVDKELVRYFTLNYVMGWFRMPTAVGPLTSVVDVNIKNAINASTPIICAHTNIEIAPSDKAHTLLQDIYLHYLDSSLVEKEIQKVLSEIDNYFEINDYVFASTIEELKDVLKEIQNFRNAFSKEHDRLSLPHNLHTKTINTIHCSIKSFAKYLSPNFKYTLNHLKILDKYCLLDRDTSAKFMKKYLHCIMTALEKCKALIKKIESESADRNNTDMSIVASGVTSSISGASTIAVLSQVAAISSVLGICGIVLVGVTAVGLGMTGMYSYMKRNKINQRLEARKLQGRSLT